jgi:hypothetical protein
MEARVPQTPFQIALAWLRALKAGDAAALARATRLPFTFASTSKRKTCERTLKARDALAPWLACVRKAQAAWLSELDVEGEPPVAEGGADGPALAGLMAKTAPGDAPWVRASMSRDGVGYRFRFVVRETEVAAFLLDAAPENG